MKTIFEHIEHVKGKPHHVRKRVAFGAAASVAVVIALVWFIGSISLGVFALKGNSFADNAAAPVLRVAGNDVGNENLAGAAAALVEPNAPAHIEIVDTATAAPPVKVEQTTIPF